MYFVIIEKKISIEKLILITKSNHQIPNMVIETSSGHNHNYQL